MWKLFRVNNKDSRKMLMTSFCVVFILNFEQISLFSGVPFVDFEQLNTCSVDATEISYFFTAGMKQYRNRLICHIFIPFAIFPVNLKWNEQLNQSCSLAFDCRSTNEKSLLSTDSQEEFFWETCKIALFRFQSLQKQYSSTRSFPGSLLETFKTPKNNSRNL